MILFFHNFQKTKFDTTFELLRKMETKEIGNLFNLSNSIYNMNCLNYELRINNNQLKHKDFIDQIPNINKLDDLYNSIDYSTESNYYYIPRFKQLLNEVHKTINYEFGLSFIYYYRIYGNWSLSTCIKNLSIFVKYQKYLNFKSLDLSDVHSIFINIKNSKLTQSTKSTEWRVMRQMFKFAGFNLDISNLKIKKPLNTKKPEELLTKEEFNSIIDGLGNHKYGKGLEYQSFFMLLADTGIRTGEAFSINKNKLIEKNGVFEVIVNGKTGERPIILYHSSLMFKLLILEGWTEWTFTYNAFRKFLKSVCYKKKITKRVYNHLLRHNFGSYIAQDPRISKEIKNKFCGWSPGSTMLDTTYTHFSNQVVLKEMKQTLIDNPLFRE